MSDQIITKTCTHCKQAKPVSEFHKSKKSTDGHQSFCKKCNRIYQKSYMPQYAKTENGRRINRKFRKSKKGLEKSRQDYRRNQNKKISSGCVRTKIKNGLMIHPSKLNCICCDNKAEQYHHHKGYAREYRYDVVPVCHTCHSKIHNQTIKIPLRNL